MRINSIHIYGFGKWQNYYVKLPENKLIIIYGDNEAGKSTMRHFLLFMLFGFPPKKREFFRPKTGGQVGGRIEVWTQKQGLFTIERTHEKNNGEAICYLEDGREREEDWLREQLQQMDEKMFLSLFSFSANDLNYLHQVKEDEIGEVLLGMGMAGTNAIHEAEKKLEQELEIRFKPYGKNPPINKQISVLEKMDKTLQELETEEAHYQSKKQTELKLISELDDYRKQDEAASNLKQHMEKKLQALPILLNYMSTKEELPAEQEVHPFPENGIERYDKLKEQILPLESELSVLMSNKEACVSNREKREAELVNENIQKEMNSVEREAETYRRQEEKLHSQKQELAVLQTKTENELDVLNTGIRFEDLEELQLPFYTEDKWDEWRQEKQMIESELHNLSRSERELENELDELKSKKSELENKLKTETAQANHLYNQEQQDNAKQTVSQQRKTVFPSLLLGGGLVLSAILLLVSVQADLSLLAFVSALIFAFSSGQWIWKRQVNKLIKRESVGSDKAAESADNQTEVKMRLDYTMEQISKQSKEVLKAQEKKKFIQEQAERLQGKIEEEVRIYPFLSGLKVEQWSKLYSLLQQVLYKYKQFESLQQSIDQLEIHMHSFESNAAALMKKLDGDRADETSVNILDEVMKKIKTQHQIKEQQKQNRERLEQLDESIVNCHQKLAPYKKEMDELLEAAATDTVESFYTKGKKKQLYQEKQKQLSSLQQQLNMFLSESEVDGMMKKELVSQWELEQEIEKAKETRKAIQTSMETTRQQLADVRSSIETMERSERLSEMRHRFEQEKTQLQESAKEWARYKLAKEALAATKRKYRQKYFPAVMKSTSEIFCSLTEGKYVKVMLAGEDNGMIAENCEGFRFKVNELSKGTHDQLYVALKIALSESTNNRNPLPFFIDDAFVHYDARRLQSVPYVLQKVESSNQILWFTCNRPIEGINGETGYIDLQKPAKGSVSIN